MVGLLLVCVTPLVAAVNLPYPVGTGYLPALRATTVHNVRVGMPVLGFPQAKPDDIQLRLPRPRLSIC